MIYAIVPSQRLPTSSYSTPGMAGRLIYRGFAAKEE
jgi:hypothetical protein